MALDTENLVGRLRTALVDAEILMEAARVARFDLGDVCSKICELGIAEVGEEHIRERIDALIDEGHLKEEGEEGRVVITREGVDDLRQAATLLQCSACDLTPENVERVIARAPVGAPESRL